MNDNLLRICALIFVAAPAVASAVSDGLTLRIERGTGSVVQAISLASADYDGQRGVLRATSVEGDRVCNGAPAAGGRHLLVLDGLAYGVERIAAGRGTFTVSPAGAGIFPLCMPRDPSGGIPARLRTKGMEGLKLSLDVIADGNLVQRDTMVDGALTYQLTDPPRLEATIVDTTLCFARPGALGKEVRFIDANGVSNRPLKGLNAFTYQPSQRSLQLDQSAGLLCFAPTGDPVASFAPPLPADDPVVCDTGAGDRDVILREGFERVEVVPDATASLQFDVRLVREPSLEEPEPLLYDYVVQNCGDRPLSDVAIREYWPGSGGSEAVGFVQDSAWEVCGASGDECGETVAGATGYVDQQIAALAPSGQPGSRVVIRAERAIARGLAGDIARLDVVAVVNTAGTAIPEHTSRSWAVEVLQVGNARPTLLVGTGVPPDSQNPVALVEDSGPTMINSPSTFLLRVEDSDSGFDCAAGCLSVTSSNDAVVASTDVRAVYLPQPDAFTGRLDLEITPRENGFGPVALSVAVVDREGGVSEPIELFLDVAPVNDPPVFRIGAGGTFRVEASKSVAQGKTVEVSPGAFCDLEQMEPQGAFTLVDPDCPTQRWGADPSFPNDELQYMNWVSGVQPGPGETAGDVTLGVELAEDPDSVITSFFFDSGTGELIYRLSGAPGEARIAISAEDAEGLTTAVSVRVIVDGGSTKARVASLAALGGEELAAPVFDRASKARVGLRPGEAFVLSSWILRARDADSMPREIHYRLARITLAGAEIRVAGRTIEIGDRFTQADIDAGRVELFIGGDTATDRFGQVELTLADSDGNLALNPVILNVNSF